MKFSFTIGVLLALLACSPDQNVVTTIDDKATTETVALYKNLFKIADKGFMFGHEDDMAYGIGWWAEEGRSDVKEVTGSYPAVHGWDVGKIGTEMNLDSVRFDDMVRWIKEVYQRGGINTISWHMDNLVSNEGSWDKTPTVKAILPEGSAHEAFLSKLDALVDFFNQCNVDGVKIPIVFRPWHEHNGDWFWWGKGNCTEEDYIALWKFTIDYLRSQGVNQLLYAFSPDRSRMNMDNLKQDYFYGYPGDEYVDIIGIDNYFDVGSEYNNKSIEESKIDFIKSLELVTQIAKEKNKVAALTETGNSGIEVPNWYTNVLLAPIRENQNTIKIAWALVWRNRFLNHMYVPHPEHPQADDFLQFKEDELTIFEEDLQNIYQ